MSITARRTSNDMLSRLKSLVNSKRFNHTVTDAGVRTRVHSDVYQQPLLSSDVASVSIDGQGYVDPLNWKKVDSRKYGISRSMVSSPSWVVLKVLQTAGFEAYLVGGCVRDLLLKKIPKDFDVITTADLNQIRRRFSRAEIVGRRFPICIVHVQGSMIEVSSFNTVAVRDNGYYERKHISPQFPQGCAEKDKIRWRDSMRRDFTVNSLFFDPFVNKIYDYANGMKDIKSLQLRTIVPAQVSFREDCARILRGLRISARLGLTISKDTVTAIRSLSQSIERLPRSRIMMELNYMLSYGAGEPSLHLLNKFKLLEYMLPFHAAYLDQLAKEHSSERSMMLMKLISNLDKMVSCDQPANCRLWIGLLAFHIALVNKPRDPLVVWTFASVLYHGSWENGVKFARKNVQNQLNFTPEICKPRDYESDTELRAKVTRFSSLVQASVDPLIDSRSLFNLMSKFPNSPCSGYVFIPWQTGKDTAQLFNLHDIEYRKCGRRFFKINHDLLKMGDLYETQFAIGKVIMDTMSNEIIQGAKHNDAKKVNLVKSLFDMYKGQIAVNADKKQSHFQFIPELLVKRQKIVEKNNTLQYEVTKSTQKSLDITTISLTERTMMLEKVQKKHLPAQPQPHEKCEEQKIVGKKESKDSVKKDVVSEKMKEITSQDETKTMVNVQKKDLPLQPHEKCEKHKRVRGKKKSKDNVKKDVFVSEKVKESTSQDGTTTMADAKKELLPAQPYEKCEEQKIVGKKKRKDSVKKDVFVSEEVKESTLQDELTATEDAQNKHLPAQTHEKCEKHKRVRRKKKSKDNDKKDVSVNEKVKENTSQDGTTTMNDAKKNHLPSQPHEKCEKQKVVRQKKKKKKSMDNVKKDVSVYEKVKENTSQDETRMATATSSTTTATTEKCGTGKKSSPKDVRVKNEKNKDSVKEISKENSRKLLSSLFN